MKTAFGSDVPTLRQLELLLSLSAADGIASAGAKIGMTPSATSHALRSLESTLGVMLIDRNASKLELTDAGDQILPHVRDLFAALQLIQATASASVGLKRGTLKIGSFGLSSSLRLLPPLLQQFRKLYPGIDLTVAIGNSQSMLQALHDYRIEIATSSFLMDDKHLYRRMIAADPIRVVTHRGHPLARRGKVALADLADHALLLREPGSMTRQLTEEALQAAGVTVKRTLEIGSRESIRQAILCELGISLIPSREIPSHPELAALDIEGADVVMHEYLYCLRERQPVQLIARFLEMAPAAG